MNALLVFVGGGLGAVLRYSAALAIGGPLATLMVNVAGGFVIGLLAAGLPLEQHSARLLLITGLLGGFTTFSAFSLDAIALAQRGAYGQAAAYVALSVTLSLAAAAAGLSMARG
ncbi:MAG: CrcB family protein [Pseudomonadota bacterium]|nr:CrcB family protein [Pseudomonadota bacterium]